MINHFYMIRGTWNAGKNITIVVDEHLPVGQQVVDC